MNLSQDSITSAKYPPQTFVILKDPVQNWPLWRRLSWPHLPPQGAMPYPGGKWVSGCAAPHCSVMLSCVSFLSLSFFPDARNVRSASSSFQAKPSWRSHPSEGVSQEEPGGEAFESLKISSPGCALPEIRNYVLVACVPVVPTLAQVFE